MYIIKNVYLWPVLLIAGGCTPTESPLLLERGRSTTEDNIAFCSLLIGKSRIFVADSKGNHQSPVTETKRSQSEPRVSPDGRNVAFLDGTKKYIFIYDIKNRKIIKKISLPGNYSVVRNYKYSPDSKYFIASLSMGYSSPSDIVKIGISGEDFDDIVNDIGDDRISAVSPSGNAIAFLSDGKFFQIDASDKKMNYLDDRKYLSLYLKIGSEYSLVDEGNEYRGFSNIFFDSNGMRLYYLVNGKDVFCYDISKKKESSILQ